MNESVVRAGAVASGIGAMTTIITGGTCPFCIITFATGVAVTAAGAVLPGGKTNDLIVLRANKHRHH